MHKVLKILIASSGFYNFSVASLSPIFAAFVLNIGGGVVMASYAWAIYAATVGTLILIFGRFEDKLNKRRVFIAGRLFTFIGVTGLLFVQSPYHLFGVQAVLGIGAAMMNPTFEALYTRGVRKGHEAFEWSIWDGSMHIVMSVGAVLGGTLVALFGFKSLFMMMSGASFVSLMLATLLLRGGLWRELGRIRVPIIKFRQKNSISR
jgi:MFS family permease